MSEDIILEKKHQAEEIIKFFVDPIENRLSKKKILDVGFELGYIPAEMIKYGADVYGVEPKTIEYKYAVETLGLKKEKFFNIFLQDLPTTYDGCFDIITCLNFSIPLAELRKVFSKAALLLKADGIFYISFADSIYDNLNPKSQLYVIMDVLKEKFGDLSIAVPGKNRYHNRIILYCKSPIKTENMSEVHIIK